MKMQPRSAYRSDSSLLLFSSGSIIYLWQFVFGDLFTKTSLNVQH